MSRAIPTLYSKLPAIFYVAMLALVVGWLFLDPHQAFAAAVEKKCTSDSDFDFQLGSGLISAIIDNIKNILSALSKGLYMAVASSSIFKYAIQGMLTLYIACYGVMFTFGMTQVTVQDFMMRMVKLGVVAMLSTSAFFNFFSGTVVLFFNGGTDELIDIFSSLATGSGPSGAGPFVTLDIAISKMFSAKMTIALISMATSGPYGPMMALLVVGCLVMFAKTMINAMFVYLMSLAMRSLLFGLAPIFLGCLLFDSTRHLFNGWLNQVVNACLQPILLFVFFAFFVSLVSSTLDRIMVTPICWTEASERVRGAPFLMHYWHYMTEGDSGALEPGEWGWAGNDKANKVFPVDVVDILILLLLVELCARFNDVVVRIAMELATAGLNLSRLGGGAMGDMMATGNRLKGAIGGRGEDEGGGTPGGGVGTPSTVGGRGATGGQVSVNAARQAGGAAAGAALSTSQQYAANLSQNISSRQGPTDE